MSDTVSSRATSVEGFAGEAASAEPRCRLGQLRCGSRNALLLVAMEDPGQRKAYAKMAQRPSTVQPMYLVDDGIEAFLACTEHQYGVGMISTMAWLRRLRELAQLVDPKDVVDLPFWSDADPADRDRIEVVGELVDVSVVSPSRRGSMRSSGGSGGLGAPDAAQPPLQLLINRSAHGLSRTWEFHQYDDDFRPATPHGHLQKDRPRDRNTTKLDPYLGWIHPASGKVVRREPREAIIRLWNDPGFRDFAQRAVMYMSESDPHWIARTRSSRPVRDPLKLPGVRRGRYR